MTESGLETLYEEGPCLVVNKPAGLLTQAPPGIDSLELRLKDMSRARRGKDGNVYLGVPHRLDRPASGAIVFAWHARAARRLAKQFERRQVQKTYWCCVAGTVEPAAGTWIDYVRKVPGEPLAQVVPEGHPEARVAVLHYRALGHTPYGAWLEITLETGRTHQVRIQAASRGYPVLGDVAYGSTVPFGPQFEDPRLRGIALHARVLVFRHPMTGEPVSITAPTSAAWAALGLPA
jgi:RluA family pseudouridine synthase